MPVDTNYFYSARLYKLILHTLRLFSDYQISIGVDENGDPILRRVPVVYMSSDKSALTLLNKGSSSTLQTFPTMILALSNVKLNQQYDAGPVYEESEVSVTEKKFDEETGEYIDQPGNSYNIVRLNPVPIGLNFTLYVLTTSQNQKFQLFEQIRAIFARELDLQTSENALDLCRLSTIRLADINWTSRGTSGLDSSQIDSMDLSFEVNAYLDLPAIVTRQTLIEKIVTNIGQLDEEALPMWSLEDVTRTFHIPNNMRLKLSYDEKTHNQYAEVYGANGVESWLDVFKRFNINYTSDNSNVQIHCTSTRNLEHEFTFIGTVEVNESTPYKAKIIINEDTLPSTTLDNVEAIIDPHHFTPVKSLNMRYLLDEELPLQTSLFGTILTMDGYPYPYDPIPASSILEWYNGNWCVALNPQVNTGNYFLRDNENIQYLYTYNTDHKIWVDAINGTYSPMSWKLSTKN